MRKEILNKTKKEYMKEVREIFKESKEEYKEEAKVMIENLMDRGLTKEEVARLIYMSPTTLNKVIKGERDIEKIEFQQLLETEEFLKENSLQELKNEINGEISSKELANRIAILIDNLATTVKCSTRILDKIWDATDYDFEVSFNLEYIIWKYVFSCPYDKTGEEYDEWKKHPLYDWYGRRLERSRINQLEDEKAAEVNKKLEKYLLTASSGNVSKSQKIKILKYLDSIESDDPDILGVEWR